MRKTISLLLIIAMMVSALIVPVYSESQSKTVVDMTGAEVTIPDNIDRVFVDWASGVTLVMTLGATEKLVTAPTAFDGDTFAWAKLICPAIADVPKNDAAYTNIEVVLGYEPQLVITNDRDNIQKYTDMGLAAIYVNYNNNDSFKQSMLIVGSALGEKEYAAAQLYNDTFDANVAFVQARVDGINTEALPTVYYMDSRFNDAYHTIGSGEIQEEWITIAGAALATSADFSGRNLEITAEKFLSIDPDMVLIGAQNQAEVYDMLMEDAVLVGLSAVQNNKVYRIPQGIFPWCRTGPEAAIQMIWAGKLFYPERFEDVDIATVAKDFYRSIYGTEVEDWVIEGILAGKLCPTGK